VIVRDGIVSDRILKVSAFERRLRVVVFMLGYIPKVDHILDEIPPQDVVDFSRRTLARSGLLKLTLTGNSIAGTLGATFLSCGTYQNAPGTDWSARLSIE